MRTARRRDMDITKKIDPQAEFTAAVRAYSEGRLDDALKRMNALLAKHPQGAPRWFAVLASIHLKKENRTLAADAFVQEARINPAVASDLLKHAVSLYHEMRQIKKICEIGEWAIEATAKDNKTASIVVSALVEDNELDRAERYLHLLDFTNPWQVTIAFVYYRSRRETGKSFEILTQGIALSPDDGYLLSTRYALGRDILEFDTMREYAQLMADLEAPRAQILFKIERALNRLYWTTSEALTAEPCIESVELATETARHQAMPRRQIAEEGRKLHIGYLSNDFFDHVVMSVLMPILKRHDESKFEFTLFCYTNPATAVAQEKWPEALRKRVVRIHGMSSPEAAKVISDHKVDILVDLKGYTLGARLDIVNLSDAPLKVGYLGYPSTVIGADLDYAITDHYITPDSSKLHWHEKLCRLPGSLMPNRPLEEVEFRSATREAWGLPEDKFIFCSFNALPKFSLRTIAMWGRILAALPDARFWIRCDLEIARQSLLKELGTHGVDPGQIIFAPGAGEFAEHIGRLALGDLALDPTPYNGHVTTSDMLRGGLPVLGLRGTTCSSRMTEGQLSVLGVPELIADSEDAYVARAIELATDREQLLAIRSKLAANKLTSPFFNADLYTRRLELAFEMMAARARAGLAPDHMDVPAID